MNNGFGVVLRPRLGGKSHEAVTYLHANPNSVMIVANHHMRKYNIDLYRKLFSMDPDPIRFMTVSDNFNRYRGTRFTDIVIDDLDYVLPTLLQRLGLPLSVKSMIVTATGVSL